MSIGAINGYSCMVLYTRSLAKLLNWILPRVNITLFNRVLADFACEFQVGKNKHIILTVDQAGWHTSQQVEIPEGIHLEFMPSHSPELQPAPEIVACCQ